MNTSKKQINFNLNDFLPFIDGLDIAINFSLVIFLSSFLLESLDTRIAVVILCFVTSLSFISRIFDLKISKLLEKLKINLLYTCYNSKGISNFFINWNFHNFSGFYRYYNFVKL